jgi:hypothetical protein
MESESEAVELELELGEMACVVKGTSAILDLTMLKVDKEMGCNSCD